VETSIFDTFIHCANHDDFLCCSNFRATENAVSYLTHSADKNGLRQLAAAAVATIKAQT